MEVISGIISTILILAALVAFPFGLRARRRALKEIAALSLGVEEKTSALEERTKSLVERVESLVGEENVAEPSAEEAYSAKYRGFDIKGELRGVPFICARDVATKLGVSNVFLMKTFLPITKEFPLTFREEYIRARVTKKEIVCEGAERIVKKSGGNWSFRTLSQHPFIQKEHAYV